MGLLGFLDGGVGDDRTKIFQFSLKFLHQDGHLFAGRNVDGGSNVRLLFKGREGSRPGLAEVFLELNADAFHVHKALDCLDAVAVFLQEFSQGFQQPFGTGISGFNVRVESTSTTASSIGVPSCWIAQVDSFSFHQIRGQRACLILDWHISKRKKIFHFRHKIGTNVSNIAHSSLQYRHFQALQALVASLEILSQINSILSHHTEVSRGFLDSHIGIAHAHGFHNGHGQLGIPASYPRPAIVHGLVPSFHLAGFLLGKFK
mmetsp:Transcript_14261/g.35783  ORF Transcript_14261/g.35783 Transcript_14261/m.35783 type:complete len:260 (-) Transcript_14261:2377-3156(-)